MLFENDFGHICSNPFSILLKGQKQKQQIKITTLNKNFPFLKKNKFYN